MDKIIIQQLAIPTTIGVYAWEQKIKQTILLDLELSIDVKAAAQQGAEKLTLDYSEIASKVTDFISNESFILLENLAETTAEFIQQHFSIPKLSLTAYKPGAVANAKTVAVSIERGQ